ncbi:MAG: hypothetical protein VKJ04_09060 [Vampirovibrionales bacterium]|nr:hypothetical protein [Vampirovibrionales bacterium]
MISSINTTHPTSFRLNGFGYSFNSGFTTQGESDFWRAHNSEHTAEDARPSSNQAQLRFSGSNHAHTGSGWVPFAGALNASNPAPASPPAGVGTRVNTLA